MLNGSDFDELFRRELATTLPGVIVLEEEPSTYIERKFFHICSPYRCDNPAPDVAANVVKVAIGTMCIHRLMDIGWNAIHFIGYNHDDWQCLTGNFSIYRMFIQKEWVATDTGVDRTPPQTSERVEQ